ncbi:MAG: preprotein translocase subunit SecG [Chlamydiota bacterium]|jgi:preprotein translocase subunit SecG|nr:MAG: preprotein translocase subunit SecG [Chlamydiae bacterium CG10_big_fil_rev_8_21_14_0_10_35_9]
MSVLFYILLFVFLFVCSLLCFVILIQESKSMGLGASFGGDPGESLFGTSTAQVLKKFTAYLAAFFMAGCIILSLWSSVIGKSETSHATFPTEQVE